MSNRLYALLIGINEYHPRSGVTSLAGCVNDMRSVQKFIKKQYKDLNPDCEELINADATRANIINTFRSHLVAKAKKGDTVLFFYAGHGSHTKSATPFRKFDGIGQDETLVCYDSRLSGKYDLTDKEIAVLLSEIAEGVHIAVIADSCHSASLTRSQRPAEVATTTGPKKRFTAGTATDRALETYLLHPDNFYTKQTSIQIPRSKHVLMSACNRDEFAWETEDQRGLFTTHLLKTLKQNPNISYRDLFARVRSLVYHTDQNQLPTLHPMEGFNPNTVFLRAATKPNPKRYQIRQTKGAWHLEYGAIDGLPTPVAEVKDLVINIYEALDDKQAIATSQISEVLLKVSVLKDTDTLKKDTFYWGEIASFPAAMMVNLEGKKANKATFWKIKNAMKLQFPFVDIVENFDAANYTLKVTKKNLQILANPDKQLIHGAEGVDKTGVQYILDILTRIEGWERVSALENKETKLDTDKLEVVYVEETDLNKPIEHASDTLTLDYFKQGEDKDGDHPKGLFYTIKAKNNSDRTLHVALIHADSEYQVLTYFPCGELPPNKDKWITLDDQHGLAILRDTIQTATDIFKIIASTEPFDDFKLKQKGFKVGAIATKKQQANRAGIERRKVQRQADWFTKTITVNLVRPQQDLGKKDTTLSNLTFKAHPSFSASLTTGQAQGTSRNVHPSQELAKLCQQEGLSLLNLSGKGTRSTQQAQTLIELNDVQNKNALADNPLELSIDAATSNGELIIPVTMQDGLLVPFGDIVQEADGSTTIKIDTFPDEVDTPVQEKGKRSIGRSLWFSLLKVTGHQDQVFLLRKVRYKNGQAERVPVKKAHIKKAKNILLAIHGIIGDTKSIIKNLAYLLEQEQYDLILTFDYENLNTPIEETAEKLNDLLSSYGLGVDDGKRLDILAHSMGGLVSRYLIEQIREGDNLVDHLYMFGTPNGGSVFGNLPAYRDKLILLLTAGLNFGKAWLGPVGATLSTVNKLLIGSLSLTKTLAQMSPTSTFTKNLGRSKKGHAKYTIIAGNTKNYHSLTDKKMAKLMEVLLIKAGDTVNHAPNDIAVLVSDILKVPDSIPAAKQKICCHHMNYFDKGPGLDMVEKYVGKK